MSADAFALFAHATASALRIGNIYFVTNLCATFRSHLGYHFKKPKIAQRS